MATPIYSCHKVPHALQVSGKLDDPLWQAAPVAALRDATTGATPRQATQVRLLYDSTWLYIGFHCVDGYIWSTFTDHESPIYTEECVEAFLNPAGTLHQYYEINISPRNVVFDACILNRRTPAEPKLPFWALTQYDPIGLKTMVHVEGDLGRPGQGRFWTVEYAVPFDQLPGAAHTPPEPGDEWRLNLYRIDESIDETIEHSAWSPPGIADFHRPWDFGTLRFEGPVKGLR